MSRPIDRMTTENLHAVLEYLSEEVQSAQTQEDLHAVMQIARDLFAPTRMQSAVQGLEHIRAEYARQTDGRKPRATPDAPPAQNAFACTVSLEMQSILSTMFQDLSERMSLLQSEAPETFANATSALNWLANGNIQSN